MTLQDNTDVARQGVSGVVGGGGNHGRNDWNKNMLAGSGTRCIGGNK